MTSTVTPSTKTASNCSCVYATNHCRHIPDLVLPTTLTGTTQTPTTRAPPCNERLISDAAKDQVAMNPHNT